MSGLDREGSARSHRERRADPHRRAGAARITGAAARIALQRTLLAWTSVLPKSVEGVDGRLVVEVTGPEPSTTTIELGAGGDATAVVRRDLGELTWLGYGRGAPTGDMLTGDAVVVEAVRPHLGFTP